MTDKDVKKMATYIQMGIISIAGKKNKEGNIIEFEKEVV